MGTPQEQERQLQEINQYQTIINNHSAPLLQDIHTLLMPQAPNIPTELVQARDMLICTKIFLTSFLGEDHILISNLELFNATLNK